ncbi:MAG: methionine--tRNA ligase [Bdellovibrionales bacterium]
MSKGPFYITTAISYVNGAPHLGHAYETILTDVMARFKRLDSYDVKFLTGTDEHGEKVAKTAAENNMTAQEFADHNAAKFIQMAKMLNISNDDFIRTTEPRHYKASQALWKKLEAKGDIYLGKYEGWYSVREEGYFTEDELHTDPTTGEKISPNGTPVSWVEEESYFFRLSNYTDKLLAYYKDNQSFIQPESRRNEITAFVGQEGGLRDLSISRHKDRLHWGIPVPDNEDHVMYVWLDALTNYITAIGYPDSQSDTYTSNWPADFHVIGKDITRFHAIYWPAFLMSADLDIPKAIFAHGFINVDGVKMSKSIGNVLSPEGMVETYGLDQIRYFLMREVPHGQDGNFNHDTAITRMNADLANGMGNLAQRTLSMIYKNCDGVIPDGQAMVEDDRGLLSFINQQLEKALKEVETFKIHRALEEIWRGVSAANGYIDAQEPWTLKKENPDRMKTVLYTLAEAIRRLAIMIQPITPDAAAKILEQLKIEEDLRLFKHCEDMYMLSSGTQINKPEGVFPRIIEEEAA